MEKEKLIAESFNLNGNSLNGKADVGIDESQPDRHTEEIQDIITKVPSWVIRWGIMVFFGVLLIVASISAIVRYPDTVKAPLRFQAVEKDVLVLSPNAGTIKQSVINQNAIVKRGQSLAVIHTAEGHDFAIISPIDGKAGFAAVIQPGVAVQYQQQLFVIHPLNQHFFGLMQIPVNVAGQVKTGQTVLISLGKTNDAQQIKGAISAITDEPDKSGMATVMAIIDNENYNLKSWMTGDAQILTKDVSVGKRIWNSILKKI